MNTEDFKRKLTAILSADVVGYSRLMGDDEATTVKTLETYKGVMFSLIKQHRGRVVDSPGDNLLAEFGSVVDAVQCAVSIQKELQTRNADLPENRRMEFRIGINLGDVIEEDDRIYGDGVNIAARLEALADPGGICVSKTAFDHIESKLPLGYEFLGDQTVKNIAKPVGAYKVLMETRVVDARSKREAKTVSFWRRKAVLTTGVIVILAIIAFLYWNFYLRSPSIEPASVEKMAYPLPDKPSIAVLPFTNMSGDPEQDYIGDGLSENIISALSISSQIFVIARNTTFTYKGKAVDIKQVSENLGVQYVLEGSIQKSGNQLRVTAQLIDALSGHHLWSEVYDREMKNLFELQDDITKKIVVSLRVELGGGEDIRLYAKSTDNLEAWKHFIKGKELYENLIDQDNAEARGYFETALDLDPQYVAAMSHLGFTHLLDFMMGWSNSPSASINRAFELGRKSMEMDDQDPLAHLLLGYISLYQKDYEKAITEGTRAITLNPNFALGCGVLGAILSYYGQFDEAITMTNKGYRLNLNLDPVFLTTLAESYMFLERYEKALEVCNEMEKHVLNGRLGEWKCFPPLYFSWVYQELGKEEEARAYMAEALKRKSDLSLEWYRRLYPYKNPAHLQRALDAFRKAGLPEKASGAVQEKPSIAVLPFDDLSPEKDQEHFVLGLSEEILNSLTQIPDLIVKARTSSFSFKGQNKTIQEIAKILSVDHVLEGSVRKYGNDIRITAQLIKADDESHLWSETYDKDLEVKEIYSIQEDIANSVAEKLKLTLEAFNLLGGTENIRAYEFYLKSKAKKAEGTLPNYKIALELIDTAIDLDPEFALAWAHKAELYLLYYVYGLFSLSPTEIDAGLKAAQKAIELEPNLGDTYIYLGYIKHLKGELLEAEENFSKALKILDKSLSSNHYFIIPYYHTVCKIKRSYELLEIIRRNDPINQTMVGWYYLTWGLLNDRHRAEEEYKGRNKLMTKSDAEWHDDMMTLVRIFSGDELSRDEIISSRQINITLKEYLASPEKGLSELIHIYNSYEKLAAIDLAFIVGWATYFGDFELAMEVIEKKVPDVTLFWFRKMQDVRQTSRFKGYIRKIGLVDYWKKYGWPDLCRPVGDDDFVCD